MCKEVRSKIFVACALGGGIGALVALQVHPFLWWVGLAVGALVGYFSYQFEDVLQAIPIAWRRAKENLPETWGTVRRGLSLSALARAARALMKAIVTVLFFLFVFLPLVLLAELAVLASIGGPMIAWGFTRGVGELGLSPSDSLIGALLFFPGLVATFGFAIFLWGDKPPEESRYPSLKDPLLALVRFNPVSVYGFCLWLLVFRIAPPVLLFIWSALVFLVRFIKCFFLLIHSEMRLLCAQDAAIGCYLGFLLASYFGLGTIAGTLLGALAGGVFGVLNFEIVSKRILHLVPVPRQ